MAYQDWLCCRIGQADGGVSYVDDAAQRFAEVV